MNLILRYIDNRLTHFKTPLERKAYLEAFSDACALFAVVPKGKRGAVVGYGVHPHSWKETDDGIKARLKVQEV